MSESNLRVISSNICSITGYSSALVNFLLYYKSRLKYQVSNATDIYNLSNRESHRQLAHTEKQYVI